MKNTFKSILKHLAVIFIGSLAAMLLLTLVYLLPDNPVKRNAFASVNTLKELGVNTTQVHGYTGTTLDTYTDAWMIRIAAYDGSENAFSKGLSAYFWGYPDADYNETISALEAYANDESNPQRYSYGRYWHGYLIFLRPLLTVLDYSDIIELMGIWVLALIVLFSVSLYKHGLAKLIPVFLAVMALINYSTVASSMQYVSVFSVALLGALAILRFNDSENHRFMTFSMIFLITGMCTSFFDFLTYPLFTLGFCMVIFLSIPSVWSDLLKVKFGAVWVVIKNSVAWGAGYFIFWGLKWIFATIFTDTNVIAEALTAINERSSSESVESNISFNILDVIKANVSIWLKWQYILVLMAVLIYVIIYILSDRKKIKNLSAVTSEAAHDVTNASSARKADLILAYLLCCLMPLAWFIISKNHSYLHCWMVYRIMSVSVFAFFSMLLSGYSLFSTRRSPI